MAEIKAYELIAGRWTDEHNVQHVFKPGRRKIIHSDKPLDQLFLNQFKCVGGLPRKPTVADEELEDLSVKKKFKPKVEAPEPDEEVTETAEEDEDDETLPVVEAPPPPPKKIKKKKG